MGGRRLSALRTERDGAGGGRRVTARQAGDGGGGGGSVTARGAAGGLSEQVYALEEELRIKDAKVRRGRDARGVGKRRGVWGCGGGSAQEER